MIDEDKTKTHAAIVSLITALLDDSRNLSGLVVIAFKDGQILFPAHAGVTQIQLATASAFLQAEASRALSKMLDERHGAPQ